MVGEGRTRLHLLRHGHPGDDVGAQPLPFVGTRLVRASEESANAAVRLACSRRHGHSRCMNRPAGSKLITR